MATESDSGNISAPIAVSRLIGSLTLRNSYDLLLIGAGGLLLPGLLLLPLPALRIPLGLVLVLFAPGYALVAAFLPTREDLDDVERVALSLGASVAVISLLAFFLDRFGWGIRPWPIVTTLSACIELFCAAGALRRRTLDPSQMIRLPLIDRRRLRLSGYRQVGRWRLLAGGLVAATVLMMGVTALFALDPTARVTEFYVLGKEGQAENYPREAQTGATLAVTMGIANHERQAHTYRVEVWSSGSGDRDQGELLAQQDQISLLPGQTYQEPIAWRMPRAGNDQQVELLLFAGQTDPPIRRLRLWLNVVSQAGQ